MSADPDLQRRHQTLQTQHQTLQAELSASRDVQAAREREVEALRKRVEDAEREVEVLREDLIQAQMRITTLLEMQGNGDNGYHLESEDEGEGRGRGGSNVSSEEASMAYDKVSLLLCALMSYSSLEYGDI